MPEIFLEFRFGSTRIMGWAISQEKCKPFLEGPFIFLWGFLFVCLFGFLLFWVLVMFCFVLQCIAAGACLGFLADTLIVVIVIIIVIIIMVRHGDAVWFLPAHRPSCEVWLPVQWLPVVWGAKFCGCAQSTNQP